MLVAIWAWGCCGTRARVAGCGDGRPLVAEIREVIAELPGAEIRDLHVWRVGQTQHAAMSLQMTTLPAQAIRERLAIHEELVHLTIGWRRPRSRRGQRCPLAAPDPARGSPASA